ALRAVEQGRVERFELVYLLRNAWFRPSHPGGHAWRPSLTDWFTRRSLHEGIVFGRIYGGQSRERQY
ncbi:MAG: hypothetical protein ABL935_05875, partial [Nitrospiraceae bacterium]